MKGSVRYSRCSGLDVCEALETARSPTSCKSSQLDFFVGGIIVSAALAPSEKVLFKQRLVEFKMLDFSD